MPLPYSSAVIPAPIDTVWAAARQFHDLPTWHPAISSCSMDTGGDGQVGAVRRLTLGDGGVVDERLLTLDDLHHVLTYTILESPFPVRRYVSTMRLAPVTATGETFFEWFAEYDSEAADQEQLDALFGDGVFAGGLSGLRDHLAAGG